MRKMRMLESTDSAPVPADNDLRNSRNSESPPSNDSDSPPPPPPPPPDSSSLDSIPSPPPPSSSFSSPPPPSPSPSRDSRSPNGSIRTPPSPPPPFHGKETGGGNKKPPPDTQQQPLPPLSGASNNETQNLLLPSPPPQSGDRSSPSSYNISKNSAAIIGGVLVGFGVLIIILVVAILVACCRKKKRQPLDSKPNYYNGQPNKKDNMPSKPGVWQAPPTLSTDMNGNYSSGPRQPILPPPHPLVALGFNKNTFTYEELATATQGFSHANVLGKGGFGFVHKGVLPNGKEIAVKSLKAGSGQGEREFQAEVDIISRVHHRHLVSLVGYCIAGGQRMLVYEFVPNKTLEFHLHGKGQPVMNFPSRIKMALGSAKGLAYLHEDCHPRIIHRDIKTANILLDNAFEAKVADFGLAKLSNDNNTHVSTRVMGTFGYLAPEYAASGKLTDKSDVFSFGVLLLELITGRCPIDIDRDEDSLVEWARPQLTRVVDEGILDGLVDPRLENNFNPQEMTRLVACAAASIRHSAKRRPRMSQIVRALEGNMSLEALNEGIKPGQTMYLGGESSSSDYDASSYRKDIEKFKRALESGDNTSSEYGASN